MGGVLLLLSKVSFYGTILILVILILVLSLKFNKKMDNKDDNEVSNEYIASYFDGEYQTEIPGKDDGYVVDKIVCDNGAVGTWDNEEWGINIRNATQKVKCSIYFKYQFEQEFGYAGNEQVLIIPKTGTYKLETWGAQGGGDNDRFIGGYGGYSSGFISLEKNDRIFVIVGELGGYCVGEACTTDIAYNGGGSCKSLSGYSSSSSCGSGGGATHIAKKSGELATLSNHQQDILIVSGGGGGSNNANYPYNYSNGGSGGGTSGTAGIYTGAQDFYLNGAGGKGATQVSGNSFGIGSCNNGNTKVGGGGGYYGGIGSDINGAGGGSGYIGNSLLTNKVMYCYNCEESNEESTKTISTTCVEETPTENCAKKGNGYARITYIG